MLSEGDIQTELYANTAITAGLTANACTSNSKAETKACCDGLKYVKNREVFYETGNGQWKCLYSDKGSGDWD